MNAAPRRRETRSERNKMHKLGKAIYNMRGRKTDMSRFWRKWYGKPDHFKSYFTQSGGMEVNKGAHGSSNGGRATRRLARDWTFGRVVWRKESK